MGRLLCLRCANSDETAMMEPNAGAARLSRDKTLFIGDRITSPAMAEWFVLFFAFICAGRGGER
jgi:hypothetical protein